MSEPNCWDACFRTNWHHEELTSNRDITNLVRYNQIGIVSFIVIAFLIVGVWSCFSVVPGFAVYDGVPNQFLAVSHTGWWLAVEILIIMIGGFSVYFAFNLNSKEAIELSIHTTSQWLVVYIVVLFIGIVSNLLHIGISLSELAHPTSTLAVDYSPFLITLLGMLGALLLLKIWGIYRVFIYNANIRSGFGMINRDVTLKEGPTQMEEDDEEQQLKGPIGFRVRPEPISMRHGFKKK